MMRLEFAVSYHAWQSGQAKGHCAIWHYYGSARYAGPRLFCQPPLPLPLALRCDTFTGESALDLVPSSGAAAAVAVPGPLRPCT